MRRGRGRGRAWALASAAGLVVAFAANLATAAPFELTWSAPAGCPSREEMVDATLARLQESRSDAPPELFVQGSVRSEGGGFVLSLALRDVLGRAVGEREVRVERQSCREVEGLGALVLALMIAVARPPHDAHAEPPREPETEPPATAPPTVDPKTPPVGLVRRSTIERPPPRSSDVRPRRLLIGASGMASFGVLPVAGLGFGVRAMISAWSIVLVGVEAAFERGGPVEFRSGEVGFQMWSASARVGVSAFQTERFELIPCVDLRGGLILTSPRGLREVDSDDRAVLVAGLGLLARARIGGSFFAEALPQVGSVFFRRQFQIRDVGGGLYDAHRVGAIEGRLSLGLGYEFR